MSTMIWAEVIAFCRNWRSFLWTVALPLLMLVLGASRTGASAILGVCATALVTGTFALGLMGYGTVLATYRERGVFQLLRCTPVPAAQLLIARMLVQLLAVIAEGVVVLWGALALYGVWVAPVRVVLMFLVLVVAGLAALALGQTVAALTRNAASTTAVSRVLLIVLFVMEGMVGGQRAWPEWLKSLTAWSPVKLAQDLLTSALSAGQLGASGGGHLAALLAWIIVIGFVGVRWFQWE